MPYPSSNRVRVERVRNGVGLLAARSFAAGRVIIPIDGVVRDAQLVTKTGGAFADNCFRYGPETYLDPGDGFGRYLNHSCAPNARIRKEGRRLELFALRSIRRGVEVTIDYSTILGDDDIWTMRCNCGAPWCRRTIKRFGSLPPLRRAELILAEAVPKYVLATLD